MIPQAATAHGGSHDHPLEIGERRIGKVRDRPAGSRNPTAPRRAPPVACRGPGSSSPDSSSEEVSAAVQADLVPGIRTGEAALAHEWLHARGHRVANPWVRGRRGRCLREREREPVSRLHLGHQPDGGKRVKQRSHEGERLGIAPAPRGPARVDPRRGAAGSRQEVRDDVVHRRDDGAERPGREPVPQALSVSFRGPGGSRPPRAAPAGEPTTGSPSKRSSASRLTRPRRTCVGQRLQRLAQPVLGRGSRSGSRPLPPRST